MFDIVDYWLEMGVDGLRLDAVPYLFEREGTNCENLPETHQALKALRRHVDERFPGRMLLAEANQWPEDAVAYFGDGDECHMAFHFPLMPRMFMSVRMEDRYPLVDILAQTPPLPEGSQWAIFLRNHDELTLEMVTDEERDYMYRVYAEDPQARINLGIRRRLAPLLGNDRRVIELVNALLLTLPGTPVIYYGDEIGMGDNFYLGDRNAVRTPMQWSGDRNGGFSRANPQRLFLPVIADPEYGAVNVEAQQSNASSLLWWMKRMIGLRKRHTAFARLDRVPALREPSRARLRARVRGGADPGGREPVAAGPVRGARRPPSGRPGAGGADRAHRVPAAVGRAAVRADARPARLLPVRAARTRAAAGRRGGAAARDPQLQRLGGRVRAAGPDAARGGAGQAPAPPALVRRQIAQDPPGLRRRRHAAGPGQGRAGGLPVPDRRRADGRGARDLRAAAGGAAGRRCPARRSDRGGQGRRGRRAAGRRRRRPRGRQGAARADPPAPPRGRKVGQPGRRARTVAAPAGRRP